MSATVLVVDDEQTARSFVGGALGDAGYEAIELDWRKAISNIKRVCKPFFCSLRCPNICPNGYAHPDIARKI